MAEVSRITAGEIKGSVESGNTLLVCAYDDDAKFASYHLEGAIPLSRFKTMVGNVDKHKQLVFYCA